MNYVPCDLARLYVVDGYYSYVGNSFSLVAAGFSALPTYIPMSWAVFQLCIIGYVIAFTLWIGRRECF